MILGHKQDTQVETVASVRDLKVHFQSKRGIVHAVDGVSFEIRDGETLGLVGETGCGKSVTGRSFLRLLQVPPGKFAGGSVSFQPQDICRYCSSKGCTSCAGTGRASTKNDSVDLLTITDEEMRRIRGDRIAMIFQDPGKALNPTMTIGAQLAEVFLQHRSKELLSMAGLPETSSGAVGRFASQDVRFGDGFLLALPPYRQRRQRILDYVNKMVAKALADTQVPNPAKLMDRYPHELSGGMKQRVMIAQALSCNPDLLIADEPTTALDVTVEAKILELIRELQQRRKTSVLYISHDLSLVRRICDRVAVMYAGRIVEIGRTDEIFQNPHHPYTRGLISAIPAAGTPRGQLEAIRGSVPELVDPPKACRFAGRCPYETNSCRTNDPELIEVSQGHSVACFITHSGPSGDQPSYSQVTT